MFMQICCTGVIGMQLLHGYNESAQIQDAVTLVATALDRLMTSGNNLTSPPASCRETTQWESGQTLFKWVFSKSMGNIMNIITFDDIVL